MSIWIGTSGWSYEDWVGPFYPAGTASRDFLGIYAQKFGCVEIDSTFYAVPAASTFQGWADRTADGFRFAPKVPGIVTHGVDGERPRIDRVLIDEGGQLGRFLERARLLGPKLATVVFQFPYFRVKEFALADFLPRLDRVLGLVGDQVRCAVEVRNKTWITEEYLDLLRKHRAACVLLDHPYMPPPEEQLRMGMVTADFTYVRLLGDRYAIEKKTRSWEKTVEDKSERIQRWADTLRTITDRAEVRDAYAFSNNHFAGHAPATCIELASKAGVTGMFTS